jgi:hypothetical protein
MYLITGGDDAEISFGFGSNADDERQRKDR